MIYTCYEMIGDCRAGKPEGWDYFILHYIPVMRRVLEHYVPDDAAARLEQVLARLRADLFGDIEPCPERQLVAVLRQKVVAAVKPTELAEVTLDLDTLRGALAPLTVVEKEAAWLETMRYAPADTGRMLRMDPATVEKIRERSAELIRGKVDRWRRTLLAENGFALGGEAATAAGASCVDVKALLDVIDGRSTWSQRQQMEMHITECWHCIDHFCRLHEVCDLLRGVQALGEAEATPYRQLFGIAAEKKPLWRRMWE